MQVVDHVTVVEGVPDGSELDVFEALYVQAFPIEERVPFDGLVDGSRQVLCARTDRLVGVAVVLPLPASRSVALEYLAVDQAERNQGIGAHLLAAITARTAAFGEHGCVLEVETIEHGDAFAARRLDFYARNGAVRLPVDYRMPNLAGGEPLPMELLWCATSPPGDVDLATLVVELYATSYGLAVDDPLVVATLQSLPPAPAVASARGPGVHGTAGSAPSVL